MAEDRGKRKLGQRRPPGVTEHRIRSSDGTITTIRKVDAASPTFGEDMLYVFRKNVSAARRENKRVTGVADVAPAAPRLVGKVGGVLDIDPSAPSCLRDAIRG